MGVAIFVREHTLKALEMRSVSIEEPAWIYIFTGITQIIIVRAVQSVYSSCQLEPSFKQHILNTNLKKFNLK